MIDALTIEADRHMCTLHTYDTQTQQRSSHWALDSLTSPEQLDRRPAEYPLSFKIKFVVSWSHVQTGLWPAQTQIKSSQPIISAWIYAPASAGCEYLTLWMKERNMHIFWSLLDLNSRLIKSFTGKFTLTQGRSRRKQDKAAVELKCCSQYDVLYVLSGLSWGCSLIMPWW